ncbi:MAG: hypothetical protein ACRDTH_05810 [Pseudonocardiaceae bacterium]
MNTLLVDITRSFAGKEETLVSAALAKHGQGDHRPIVIGLDAQRSALEISIELVEFRVAPGAYEPEVLGFVAEVVHEHLNRDASMRFTIYSYHPMIFTKQGELAGIAEALNINSPLELLRENNIGECDRWPAQLMPLEEALHLLRIGLRQAGASTNPVSKTNVRNILQTHDQRFDKRVNPAARTLNLITMLLEAAQRQGWVQLRGKHPKVDVWLVETSASNEVSWIDRPNTSADIELKSNEAAREPLSTRMDGAGHDPRAPKKQPFVPETRSQVFQAALWAGIGLHADVRELLWDSLEELLKEDPDVRSVGHTIGRAVAIARDRAPTTFPRPKEDFPKEAYPWRKLEGFAVTVCVRAGLIENGDGTIMSPGPFWEVRRGRFTSSPSDWRMRIDAELLLEIIRRCKNVTWDDGPDLAGALFLDRDEQHEHRINHAFEILGARGAIDLDLETGFLSETRRA